MKVLLIHNFYSSSAPSGENSVFKNEITLLRKKGIPAITYTRFNDEIANFSFLGKLSVSFQLPWSMKTYKELKEIIKREKPDIAHFHNIWYLITPSAYYACKDMGIPVIQTFHNFRIFCANGLLLRNYQVCEDCLGKLPFNAIKYGCYRNSRIYSLPIVLTQYINSILKTWQNKVDAYIALTEFAKDKLIQSGLSHEKFFVKPNFISNPPIPCYKFDNYILFVGRLSAEKGINILIEAFKLVNNNHHKVSLIIVGDGALRDQLELKVKKEMLKQIEFLGKKSRSDVLNLIQRAKFVVFPSICYEMFPLVVIEAFACGKPVIASSIGAMAELVEDGKTGLLFESGNANDLAEKIKWMLEHEEERIQMGKNARQVFEEKYTAERNFEILIKIYTEVIRRSRL